MPHIVDTTKYLDAVCLMLQEGQQEVPVPVRGVSMRPFLRDGDTVFLNAVTEPVRRGDIVLFLRRNGQYVLHRIMKITPAGNYLIQGDSQLMPEPVLREQLRGRVCYVRCGEQILRPGSLRWRLFAGPWRWLAPWRKQIIHIRSCFRKQ